MPIPYHIATRKLLDLLGHSQAMRDAQISLLCSPGDKSVRSLWYEIYKDAVKHELIQPVENMEQLEKEELWKHTIESAKNLDLPTKIIVAKCFYVIEYYLNLEV